MSGNKIAKSLCQFVAQMIEWTNHLVSMFSYESRNSSLYLVHCPFWPPSFHRCFISFALPLRLPSIKLVHVHRFFSLDVLCLLNPAPHSKPFAYSYKLLKSVYYWVYVYIMYPSTHTHIHTPNCGHNERPRRFRNELLESFVWVCNFTINFRFI